MSNQPKCPQCGAILKEDAPAGLCPNCLMALNLKTETILSGDAPAAEPPLPPDQIAPHFPQLEILTCLGRGGMGVVYKARQKSLNRFVALKLLAPERANDAAFAERFAREARALAALNHPNIVTVHDFGQAGGFYFLLMEFVDGVNLRQLLRTRKFSPEEALAIVPPLCDALQFAHERGIVHRDIKPENLLLDKSGRVKIADFGIAKMLGTGDSKASSTAGENSTREAMGTLGYSAPEQQASPERVDNRADIYSLGVVFYELLTGELPGKRIEPPSKRVQVDVRLDAVVLRALEQTPELRWQTAADLRTQVETIASEPMKSRPGEPASGTARQQSVPVVPAAIGLTYLGTILCGALCELLTGHVLGHWIVGIFVLLGGTSLVLVSVLKTSATERQRRMFRLVSATSALNAALPVIWLAIFFLHNGRFQTFHLNTTVTEFTVVLLTWLGAVLLPYSFWQLASGVARPLGMTLVGLALLGSTVISVYEGHRVARAQQELARSREAAATAHALRVGNLHVPAFGPEIERLVNDVSVGTNTFLNLDRGIFLTPPPEVQSLFAGDGWVENLETEGQGKILQKWAQKSDADVFCVLSKRGLCQLGGFSISSFSETGETDSGNDYWQLTATQLIELVDLVGGDRESGGRIAVLPHVTDFSMHVEEDRKARSFAFKLRNGSYGVLQITGFSENPPGIKIRYKMVRQ